MAGARSSGKGKKLRLNMAEVHTFTVNFHRKLTIVNNCYNIMYFAQAICPNTILDSILFSTSCKLRFNISFCYKSKRIRLNNVKVKQNM